MEMMLDKKQIRAIFLFKFKMGHKTVETTCDINSAFGPGTANKGKVQWWFKKFCKADKSLENEEHSGQPSQVDNNQLRAITEADSFTPIWETADELNVDHSNVIWHLKQIGKVKKLYNWVPHELTEKKMLFWSVIFSYSVLFHSICIHSVMTNSLQPHGLYVSHQTHMPTEFSRQEYWSELPFPFLGVLPDPGIEPGSPALQVNSLPF